MTTVQVGTFRPLIFSLLLVLCNHVFFVVCLFPFFSSSTSTCSSTHPPLVPWRVKYLFSQANMFCFQVPTPGSAMGTCRHKRRRDLVHQHEQLNSKLCNLFILFYFSLRRRHGRQGTGGGEAGSSTAWQDTQPPDGDTTSSTPVAMAATQ